MNTILLLGASGGLGEPLYKMMHYDYGSDLAGLSSNDLDITNKIAVDNYFNDRNITAVINLAGVNYDGFMHKPFSEENINRMIDVNIKGTINILNACLPKMREKNFGRIILASSMLAKTPVPGTGIYSACKSFIDSITKTVALENASKGITCNSLQLGYFNGGLTYKIPEEVREKLINNIPSKKLGRISIIYDTIEYLFNNEYITGQNINISGGLQ